jgi:hypothetical protein
MNNNKTEHPGKYFTKKTSALDLLFHVEVRRLCQRFNFDSLDE